MQLKRKTKKLAIDFTKWFYRKASVIIVPGESIKKLFQSYGLKNKIKVLPTGIKTEILRKHKINKVKKILHVGRLCGHKRIETVLEAFKEISEKINAKLIITSDGPYRKELEKISKDLGIDKKVVFTGYVSNEKLLDLYSSSDVFVSASDTETQGIVVLEAFSCGCPVVVRDALGLKDLVKNEKNGFLFKDNDEFVEKVLLVLKNEKIRKRFIENGYKTATKFNLLNSAKDLEKIYEEAYKKSYGPKTYWKIVYGGSLLFSILQANIIRNLEIPINSRFLKFLRLFMRLSLKIESLYQNI